MKRKSTFFVGILHHRALLSFIALWFLPAAQAATVSWKAAVSGNWNDGGNWSSGSPPGDGDTVQINVAGTYAVTVNVAASPGALTVNPASGTATLLINTGTFA